MTSRVQIALVALLAVLPACRGARAPEQAVAVPSASAATAQRGPPARQTARCPLVPLRLAVRAPGHAPVTVLSLDASGRVAVSMSGASPLEARLDPRGCLVGPDGLWAELSPDGSLWTQHESLPVHGATIELPTGGLRIDPDGTVDRLDADGGVDSAASGVFVLEGYRPDAECAGQLLVTTFLSMMPSMAVVDGRPAMAPPPSGSLCNEYRGDAGTPGH